jgi:hypothetical protein
LTTFTRTRCRRSRALLYGVDLADVQPNRGVELECIAAGRRLRVAVHDADLHAELVDEDDGGLRATDRARELAQSLAHQPCLQADVSIAHLALDLGAWDQCSDRVDHDDVHRARAHQRFGDLQRLLTGVRLRDQEVVEIDTEALSIDRIEGVFGVDVRGDTTHPLGLGDHVEGERRLSARLGTEDLGNSTARNPTDPECEVEGDRTGRNDIDLELGWVLAHPHDGAFAEAALDLRDREFQCLLPIHRCRLPLTDRAGIEPMFEFCSIVLSRFVPVNRQ